MTAMLHLLPCSGIRSSLRSPITTCARRGSRGGRASLLLSGQVRLPGMGLWLLVLVNGMAVRSVAGAGLRLTLGMTAAAVRDAGRMCMVTVVGLRVGELIMLPIAMIGRLALLEALMCAGSRAVAVDPRTTGTRTSRRVTTGRRRPEAAPRTAVSPAVAATRAGRRASPTRLPVATTIGRRRPQGAPRTAVSPPVEETRAGSRAGAARKPVAATDGQ